jgi:V/A-type H+-transporting ATPase subunit C
MNKKFGNYPYTATRVKVSRALLLTGDDYVKIRKMGLNEMIRFLEEREYKNEIDALSSQYKGMELINVALNENLANTINKLLKISTRESHVLIKNYAMRWVISNLKIVIRSKDSDLVKKSIIPVAPTTYEYCLELIKRDKDEFVREVSRITGIDAENFKKLYEENDIISMENELDKAYYSILTSIYKALESGMLKNFYKFLVELLDIKNIIKLKSIGVPRETVASLVITKSVLVNQLTNESLDGCIKLLKESKYSIFVENIEEDLSRLENNIEKYLMQYSFKLLHLKPLSIAPIFGYLLAKEIEVRNLKLLVNAKAMKLEEDFVEKNLIIEE